MTTPSITALLCGGALAAVAALAPTTGALAQVRCSSDGYRWHCQDGYFAPVPAPAWGYRQGWGHDYGGDYNQIPDDYPGPGPFKDGD
ncbi:MAG TPA: hypothetical protein VHW66_20560 [Stellaceae bacterium]|jgi:hypothetical protein|nr:hypothetical protein [Stellaceae bacterium]